MKRMVIVVGPMMAILLGLGLQPTEVRAQDCGDKCLQEGAYHEFISWYCDELFPAEECQGCDLEWSSGHDGCHDEPLLGYCSDHEACAPEEEEEALLAAVETDDWRAVASLLEAHPTAVFLNERRGAVQLRNCGGIVVGHVPISPEGMEALAALGARSS